MNRFKYIVTLLIMALFTSSCMAQPTANKVVSLTYRQTSSNMIPDIWFELRTQEDGTLTLTNSTGRMPTEALRAIVPSEVAEQLAQLVKQEKMYKYKDHYEPPFTVYDGWQWYLHIYFDDKTSISSSGHMDMPNGEGLQHLEQYLNDVWSQVDETQAEIVNIW